MRLDVEIDRVQYLLSGLTHPQIRRIDDNTEEIGLRVCNYHVPTSFPLGVGVQDDYSG